MRMSVETLEARRMLASAVYSALVKDINTDTNSSTPAQFVPFDGAGANGALFVANDGATNLYNQLWKTDGTAAGTKMLSPISAGPGATDPNLASSSRRRCRRSSR